MRIAVVGAYGNGKTTLTTALSHLLGIPRTHGAPMRGPLGAPGKSLEECTEPELLQLAVRRFTDRAVDEARRGDAFISDGSALHEWIYTKVRLVLGRHPEPPARLADAPRSARTALYEELTDHLGLITKQHARHAYDVFVHLPDEIPLPAGKSPISRHFRSLSDQLVLDTLNELKRPVHIVRGSVAERLHHIVPHISLPSTMTAEEAAAKAGH